MEGLSRSDFPPSVRMYLPRALRVVYDIRNNRDVAHLADGIDPSLQDAALVVGVLDWVVAEFVRLSGRVTVEEGQALIDGLVTRAVPAIQEFDGIPKVLRSDLRASNHVLVLLYSRAPAAVALSELRVWVPTPMKANLARTLNGLDEKALVHVRDGKATITFAGQRHVEKNGLLGPLAG